MAGMSARRQAAFNYAGLAALITAAGGTYALFNNQSNQAKQQDNVQASTLAVLQYRLQVLEKVCLPPILGGAGHAVSTTPPEMDPPEPPAPAGGLEPEIGTAVVAGASEPGTEAPGATHQVIWEKIRGRQAVNLDEIKEYVQKSGKPLRLEDF